MTGIQAIIDRAASDPDFLWRLASDPLGTVQAEGYEVSDDEVKAMLDMAGASDEEMVEAVKHRLTHCQPLF